VCPPVIFIRTNLIHDFTAVTFFREIDRLLEKARFLVLLFFCHGSVRLMSWLSFECTLTAVETVVDLEFWQGSAGSRSPSSIPTLFLLASIPLSNTSVIIHHI